MKKFLSLLLTIILLLSFAGCIRLDDTRSLGKLYTLQEAFDEGHITHEDLVQIAAYHDVLNSASCSDELDDEIGKKIKAVGAKWMVDKNWYSDVKEDDVFIVKYHGTYNGAVVVEMEHVNSRYPDVSDPVYEEVDGVVFHFTQRAFIKRLLVWKE